jgi:hypothetical protein
MGAWAESERRAQRRVEVSLVRQAGYAAADIPPGENPTAGLIAADECRGNPLAPFREKLSSGVYQLLSDHLHRRNDEH